MEAKRPATSIQTGRARDVILVAVGRATAANVVVVSALDTLEAARAAGDVQMSDMARERLSRLMLEVSAKTNEFRRELEEILAAQTP